MCVRIVYVIVRGARKSANTDSNLNLFTFGNLLHLSVYIFQCHNPYVRLSVALKGAA